MLKDLFQNRLFIGALAFFIFCVVGGTLYMWHVEREGAEYTAETQARGSPLTENAQPTTAVADGGDSADGDVHVDSDSLKSDGSRPDSATTSGGETSVPELSEAEVERLLAENRAQQAKHRADYIAEWGEPPPPDLSWQHYRDNHGDVHRHYQGTVAISHYDYITRFAPTPEELERYMQLHVALKEATLADKGGSWENPSPEVQRLDTEKKSLYERAQREIPFPNGFRYYGEPNSGFPSEAENERLRSIAIRDFYQRFEMEHLYELHEESTKFYQKY